MTAYGVIPTGFHRKPLSVILSDIEEAMIAEFGPLVVQTSQSPLGQLNGLMSAAIAEMWEITEDTYQSFDVDQAQGPRLDMLAKLRRLERNTGEIDQVFQPRITNQGAADIRLITNINRLKELEGVTWADARENATPVTDMFGIPAHSVAYAVMGGADDAVAERVFNLTAPGVGLYGNAMIDVQVNGYCRIVHFVRPKDVSIKIEAEVKHVSSSCHCAPFSVAAIINHIEAAFAGPCGFRNGDSVTKERIEAEFGRLGNLKVMELRIARNDNLVQADTLSHTLFERPVVTAPLISVEYVTS